MNFLVMEFQTFFFRRNLFFFWNDHVNKSHNLLSWICSKTLKRSWELITGNGRIKRASGFAFVWWAELSSLFKNLATSCSQSEQDVSILQTMKRKTKANFPALATSYVFSCNWVLRVVSRLAWGKVLPRFAQWYKWYVLFRVLIGKVLYLHSLWLTSCDNFGVFSS